MTGLFQKVVGNGAVDILQLDSLLEYFYFWLAPLERVVDTVTGQEVDDLVVDEYFGRTGSAL